MTWPPERGSEAGWDAWCRQHFAMMREGGIWGVPRSGLVFVKRAGELVLTGRMPWSDELATAAKAGWDVPADAASLREFQDEDLAGIRERFGRVGVEVREEVLGDV